MSADSVELGVSRVPSNRAPIEHLGPVPGRTQGRTGGAAVSVADVLELRNGGLAEPETWALLCQAVQALQDLFLSDGGVPGRILPLVSPGLLQITSRGRVHLGVVHHSTQLPQRFIPYMAPEYRSTKRHCDNDSEKMWIYSLGMTLKRTTSESSISPGLSDVMETMCRRDPEERASLMYLLDVISDYYKSQRQVKPFSHIVMSLHQEVLGVFQDKNFEAQPPAPQLQLDRNDAKFRAAVDKGCLKSTPKTDERSDTDSGRSTAFGQLLRTTKTSQVASGATRVEARDGTRDCRPVTREASTCTDIARLKVRRYPRAATAPVDDSLCISHEFPGRRDHDLPSMDKNPEKECRLWPTDVAGIPVIVHKSQSARDAVPRLRVHRNPVQRVASRLYGAAKTSVNQRGQHIPVEDGPILQCVGPEFVIRSAHPRRQLVIPTQCKAILNRQVTVILLNGQKLDIICDATHTTAGHIFEAIIKSEGLEPNFTLGISALLSGDFVFLPDDTKISKLAPPGWIGSGNNKKQLIVPVEFTLFLRIKFYLPSLRNVRSTQSKHLLYLQLRRAIVEQQLICSAKQLVTLSGFALQAEFGDYTNKEHGNSQYFILEHYAPDSIIMAKGKRFLTVQLQVAHQQCNGLSADTAEEGFIQQAQTLADYGAHFYTATWTTKDGCLRDIRLAITAHGLTLYERNTNVVNRNCDKTDSTKDRVVCEDFSWREIQTLCYSKHYLCIVPHAANNSKHSRTMKYKLKMDRRKSFFTFQLASLHHQFFLRLRSVYSSLQSLSEEFGVPLKDIKNENNKLYKIENQQQTVSNSERGVTQFKMISRESSNSSGDSEPKEFSGRLKSKLSRRSKSTTEIQLIDNVMRLEEYQNKENESPKYSADDFFFSSLDNNIFNNSSSEHSNVLLGDESQGGTRRGVKMGTRAFSGTSHKEQFLSLDAIHSVLLPKMNSDCLSVRSSMMNENIVEIHRNFPDNELPSVSDDCDRLSLQSISLHSMCFQSDKADSDVSPVPEAYVLHSSIKSTDDRLFQDFQETISDSLMEKFNNMSFEEERILSTVRITRDTTYSLGLQITEGSDGNVYIQSVIPGGPAAISERIHKGDQIIAVDGFSLLNLTYSEALNILQNTGNDVEFILSQVYDPRPESLIMKSKCHNRTPFKRLNDCGRNDLYVACLTNAAQTNLNNKSIKQPLNSYLNSLRYETAIELEEPGHVSEKKIYAESKLVDEVHNKSVMIKTKSMPLLSCIKNIPKVVCTMSKHKPALHVSKNSKSDSENLNEADGKISKVPLPRVMGMCRKWEGPVKYPVTPAKESLLKGTKISLAAGASRVANVSANVDGSLNDTGVSEDEQFFI